MGPGWAATRLQVLERDGWACQMLRDGAPCGRPASTVDHIVARSRGGTDDPANLRAACADCNTRAGGLLTAATTPPPATLTRRQAQLVTLLDTAGAPTAAGRRTALRILTATGRRPPRSEDLDTACRWRRHRPRRPVDHQVDPVVDVELAEPSRAW